MAALASFKLTIGSPRPVAAAEMPLQSKIEVPETVAELVANGAIKGDRLQLVNVPAVAPAVTDPKSALQLDTSPEIVSRHWHEKSGQVAIRKRRAPKIES